MPLGSFVPSRPRSGILRRFRRRLFSAVPLMAWLAGAALLLILWNERVALTQVKGLAEALAYVVAPPVDGCILSLPVALGQRIEAGQVVARIEDTGLRLRLKRARNDLERLRAELTRDEALLGSNWHLELITRDLMRMREAHRHARDLENARLEILITRAELEETRIRHRGIYDELGRQRPLLASGVLSGSHLCRLETDESALGKRIEELSTLLGAREERLAAAWERKEDFRITSGSDPEFAPFQLEPLQWRIRVQEVALEELLHEIESLAIKAPGDGIVANVAFRPGEFVRRGTPILTIVQPRTPEVTAYVPEQIWESLGPSPLIQLGPFDAPGRLREARLLGLSPGLVRVPDRLWADPRVEEWALAVRLDASGNEIPGQLLRVYLRRR